MDNFDNEEGLNTLLDSLVLYTKFYHKHYTKESLIEGLPIKKGEKNPHLFSIRNAKGLFSRAAEHAGLKTKLIQKNIEDFSNLQLPVILLLTNGNSCLLDSYSQDRKKVKIISELSGDIVEEWNTIESMKEEYLGYAILVKKAFDFKHTDVNKNLNIENKH